MHIFLLLAVLFLAVNAEANVRVFAVASTCSANLSVIDITYYDQAGKAWIGRIKQRQEKIELYRRPFANNAQALIEGPGSAFEYFDQASRGRAKKNFLYWKKIIAQNSQFCRMVSNNQPASAQHKSAQNIADSIHKYRFVAKLNKPHKKQNGPP